MSALAEILSSFGKSVRGYDRVRSEYTDDLLRFGISADIGSGDIGDCDAVVYTDAIAGNDPLLMRARKEGKKLISRGELLYEVSSLYSEVIAVAGCHGKTTCTAMLSHIFHRANLAFTAHIGGKDLDFLNCKIGGNRIFLTEACEYKKNFLYLKPDVSVILNSDADHLDCYGSEENLKNAYVCFAEASRRVVKLYGDLPTVQATTFGFDDRADYYAKNICGSGGKFSFVAYEKGSPLCKIDLRVFGKHNVLNALAAVAAARLSGVPQEAIVQGLASFRGVERRFEEIGTINGAKCVADYAHHPNEIKAALRTARLVSEGNIYVVFQPHTYSRTKTLFKEFCRVLSPMKRLLIYKTFAAREYYDDAGSALTLSKAMKRSRYGQSEEDICEFLSDVSPRDTVLFLGAGDIYEIAKGLTDRAADSRQD